MGAVYRVLDLRTGKRLALKRLHVKNRKDEALAHFEREFYVLAQLRHPRIIGRSDCRSPGGCARDPGVADAEL